MTGDDTMVSAGLICFNTNLAAALATVAALIVSWVRYGKPDVSLTFNGALAGLVAITAGCDVVDPVRRGHHRHRRRCALHLLG